MCSNSVSCPLCFHSSFPNIDSLRISLINAANGPISCPICNEILLGLDKLTIHLFSHTSLLLSVSGPDTTSALQNFVKTQPNHQQLESPPSQPIVISTSALIENGGPVPVIPIPDACVSSPIKCDICGLTIRSADLLRMHNKLIHRIPDDVLSATTADIRYQCHLCAKIFKMKGSLRVHLKVVHMIGLSPASSSTTSSKNSLKLNIFQKIKSRNDPGSSSSPAATTPLPVAITLPAAATPLPPGAIPLPPTAAPLPPTAAPLPSTATATATGGPMNSELQQQSPSQHQVNCSETQAISENSQINSPSLTTEVVTVPTASETTPRNTDSAKIWECDTCSKSFTTKYFLKKHKRLHTGEMPYTCSICGKTFTFQQSYHKHLLYHSDDKPHICQICGRAFKELSTLHNHERIHSGEKPFKCEICAKCFRQRVSYLVHKRIHTGAMPYKCTACDKNFRYKVSQRTHKCPAQPPGMVIRQTGDLLEKLLQCTAILSSNSEEDSPIGPVMELTGRQDVDDNRLSSVQHSNEENNMADNMAVDSIRTDSNDEAELLKSIDEIVSESCNKMGIENVPSEVDDRQKMIGTKDVSNTADSIIRTPSPSRKFENLCLYSPCDSTLMILPLVDVIGEESLKQLLQETNSNVC